MKTYWENGGIASRILNLDTRRSFRPQPLYPGDITSCNLWVGLIAVLDAVVKRKIPSPCQESNPAQALIKATTGSNLPFITTLTSQH
jgi:hypothetical protein